MNVLLTKTKSKLAVSNEKRGELEILNDDLTKKVETIMEEKVELEENAKEQVILLYISIRTSIMRI